MINVDKYLFMGKYADLNLEEYLRMIEWVTTNISPPMQGYDYTYNNSAIGRCGDGWELRLDFPTSPTMLNPHPRRRMVEWHMFIDDDCIAVMFKLMWP